MSSITCPHCAQAFDNYNNEVKATKCPYCGGGIGYEEGDTVIDKKYFPRLFKIALILGPFAGLKIGIDEDCNWYQIIGYMIFAPIALILGFYFLTHYKGSDPVKK
jgi:uncharacterized protein (DUF983 family)